MELFLAVAALTVLAMLGSFLYLTRDDRALLAEQNSLPDDLRIRPLPLTEPASSDYHQAA